MIDNIVSVIRYLWLFADCYDPLDPNGNIAITFDITQYTDDGYVVGTLVKLFYILVLPHDGSSSTAYF